MKAEDCKTAQDFYDFFSKIPEEKWITNSFAFNDKHCALGHLGRRGLEMPYEADAAVVLTKIFHKHLNSHPTWVNDVPSFKYPLPTPKKRILAALQDIIKMESAGHD